MNRCTNKDSSWKKYTSRPILAALVVAGIAHVDTAHAVLATGDILSITSGTVDANSGYVNGGSWFGMDMSSNTQIGAAEKTAITNVNGIPVGVLIRATGSHTGPINGSESPAFDKWEFFGNTGLHHIRVNTSPAQAVITDNSNGTLVWSGWTVAWNAIAAIPMNANAWQPAGTNCAALGCTGWTFTNSTARFQCGSPLSSCTNATNGVAYTLDYTATVPNGDPSGFGNVKYYLHLVGTVTKVGALSAAVGATSKTVSAGSLGAIRVGESQLTSASIPLDDTNSAIVHRDGMYYDFVVSGLSAGNQVDVVIPLSVPLPTSAIYRKYNSGTGLWSTFTQDGSNTIKSAPGTPDACPAAGDAAYTTGLTAGYYCVQLTILNGGANDSDSSATTVTDPGGIATGPIATSVDIRSGATGGCSLSSSRVSLADRGDWWLMVGFVAWLGMVLRRRQSRA
jgi:hypothetical protein